MFDTHDLSPGDYPINLDCNEFKKPDHDDPECAKQELCAMIDSFNKSKTKKKRISPSPSERGTTKAERRRNKSYKRGLKVFRERFAAAPDSEKRKFFNTDCLYENWKKNPNQAMSPDHEHDAGLGGAIAGAAAQANMSFATCKVNRDLGACMKGYNPKIHGKCVAHKNCNCPS